MKTPKKQSKNKNPIADSSKLKIIKKRHRNNRPEVSIHENEECFQSIFEENPLGMALVRLDFHFDKVNAIFCKMLGYSKRELLAKTFKDIAHPDNASAYVQSLKKLIKGTIPIYRFESRYVRKNKDIIWCALTITAVHNKKKQFQYFVAMIEDITDRKRTEEQFKTLFMSISEGFYLSEIIYDKKGNPCDYRYLEVNPKFEQIMGLNRNQLIGKRYKELVPVDTTQWLDVYCKVAHFGKPITYQFYSNEYQKYFETFSYKSGKDQVTVFVLDITERKLAEESLRQSEARLAAFMSFVPALILIKDFELRPIYANDNYKKIFPIDKWMGKKPHEVFPPDVADKMVEKDTDALKKGFASYEENWNDKQGEQHVFFTQKFKIDNPGNNPLLGAIISDITERKLAEEALKKSESKFRSLFTQMSEGFALHEVIYDSNHKAIDYKILEVNPAFEKYIGYPKEKAEGALATQIYGISPAPYLDIYAHVAATGENQFFQTYFPKLNRYFNISVFSHSQGYFATVFMDITERKKAEEALQLERDFNQTLIQSSPAFFVAIQADGKLLMMSNSMLNALGYSLEEVVGVDYMTTFVPESDHEKLGKVFLHLTKETGSTINENRVLSKNGQELLVEWHGKPIFKDKKLDYFIGVGIDITERKQAEEMLRESEERFEKFMANMPAVAFIKDHDSRLIYANPTLKDLFGWENAVGKLSTELLPPELANQMIADDKRVMENGQEIVHEKVVDINGVKHYFETHKFSFLKKNGEILLGGVSIDETARKQTEEQLLIKDFAIESSISAIGLADLNGKLIYANKAFVKLWGYDDKNELVGKNIAEMEESEKQVEEITNSVRKTGMYFGEIKALKKDKTPIDAQLSVNFVTSPDDKPVCMMVSFIDITERKRMEARIRLSEEHYRTLVETTPDAIVIIGETGKILFASRKSYDVFGIPTDQSIIGKSILDWIAPEQYGNVMGRLSDILTGQAKSEAREYTLRKSDGTVFWGEINSSRLINPKDEVTGLLLICRDVSERKKIFEALNESEKKYRELIDGMVETVWVIDFDGNLIDVNNAAVKVLGYSKDELLAMGLYGIETSLKKEYIQSLARKMPLDKIQIFETTHKTKDGRTLPVEVYSSLVTYQGKKVILSIARDITERKQAEEAIRKSEERLRKAQTIAHVGNWELDLQNKKMWGSEEAFNIYGLERKTVELSLEFVQSLVLEVHRPAMDKAIQRLVAKTGEYNEEYQIKRANDGEIRDIFSIAELVLSPDGTPEKVVGVIQDITERKQMEEITRESEEKFRMVFENVFDGISIYSEDNDEYKRKIIECNEQYAAMAGRSREELLRIGVTQGIQKTLEDTVNKNRLESIANEKAYRGLFSWIRPDGKENIIEFVGVPVIWHGKPFSIGIDRDITEQRKLQQELLQSQKMQSIGTLAGGIAHDFNNILGIILGYSSILEKQKQDDPKLANSLAAINQAVHRGAALVRQILTFARKTDVQFEAMNVNDLAHELLSMLQQTFPKIITFKEITEKDIPYIQADRTQIHQALLNLCVNARDAMPNGGSLTIQTNKVTREKIRELFQTAEKNVYVCISVTDTGEGMNEETRAQIFDPFFTTKEKGKGTGLGLSVTYGVMKTHNGFIHVESELGHGSTFRLYFPVPDASENIVGSQTSADYFDTGGTETILIIEDEELLIEMVHLLLEAKGYKVYTAHDGIEAVNVYKEHGQDIALVLSDMGLPGITGTEVFQKIKEINPDVKVVLASGYFDPDDKSELLKAGAKGFIQKPYLPNDILREIRKVLDKKTE